MLAGKVLLAHKLGSDKSRQQRYNVSGMAVTTPTCHPQAAHEAVALCAVLSFPARRRGPAQRTLSREWSAGCRRPEAAAATTPSRTTMTAASQVAGSGSRGS